MPLLEGYDQLYLNGEVPPVVVFEKTIDWFTSIDTVAGDKVTFGNLCTVIDTDEDVPEFDRLSVTVRETE